MCQADITPKQYKLGIIFRVVLSQFNFVYKPFTEGEAWVICCRGRTVRLLATGTSNQQLFNRIEPKPNQQVNKSLDQQPEQQPAMEPGSCWQQFRFHQHIAGLTSK
jgi:hypothetical protein